MSDTYLPPAVAKVPVRLGDFLPIIEMIKEALQDHKDRLHALDGLGVTKAAKPRVRVPSRGFTPRPGDEYETTDGITYRLKGWRRPDGA